MPYSIAFAPSARKAFANLSQQVKRRLQAAIDALADNPRPHGVTPLSGHDDLWRIRVGDYRVVSAIRDRELLILVVKVGHRREIYRDL